MEPGDTEKRRREKDLERDILVGTSMNEIEDLGLRLSRGEIDKAAYETEVKRIEESVRSLGGLPKGGVGSAPPWSGKSASARKPPSEEGGEDGQDRFWLAKVVLAILLVLMVLVYLYMHSTCVGVGFSTQAPRILSLIGLVRNNSPGDYDMMCRYVDYMDYRASRAKGGYAVIYPEGREGDRTVILSSYMMDAYDDRMAAGVVVHEACHQMMNSIMGGSDDMNEKDVERPCERMRYMFMYRAGAYGTYQEMVSALSKEEYGRGSLYYTSGIPDALREYRQDRIYRFSGSVKPYCSRTSLNVSKVEDKSGKSLVLRNSGDTTIHCGFVELLVSGLEYPLDCSELAPGESRQTGKDFKLKSNDSYTVRVVGCEKK